MQLVRQRPPHILPHSTLLLQQALRRTTASSHLGIKSRVSQPTQAGTAGQCAAPARYGGGTAGTQQQIQEAPTGDNTCRMHMIRHVAGDWKCQLCCTCQQLYRASNSSRPSPVQSAAVQPTLDCHTWSGRVHRMQKPLLFENAQQLSVNMQPTKAIHAVMTLQRWLLDCGELSSRAVPTCMGGTAATLTGYRPPLPQQPKSLLHAALGQHGVISQLLSQQLHDLQPQAVQQQQQQKPVQRRTQHHGVSRNTYKEVVPGTATLPPQPTQHSR